jgi:GTP-binding protein YchF
LKEAQVEEGLLERIRQALLQAKSARTVQPQNNDEEALMEAFQLITTKPVLYVCNVDEESAATGNNYVEQVRELVKDENAQVIVLAVGTEADITELETYEERQMFLEDLGLTEPGASVLIRSAYKLLNQQTYFTAGVKEVRAWTINVGDTAPQAAGVIHTDFEKGFIRAEVIAYDDYVTYGTEAKVKEAGKLRVEGKEYIVKDGDVMHFRFNV